MMLKLKELLGFYMVILLGSSFSNMAYLPAVPLLPAIIILPSFDFIIIKINFLPFLTSFTAIAGVCGDICRKRFIYAKAYGRTPPA